MWRALEEELDATFSESVRRRHSPSPDVLIRECAGCGLQYFDPPVAGDEEFYRELMRSVAYDEDRWEWRVVAARLRGGAALVDFGCGEGAFLRRVAPLTRRAVGVDYNLDAVARLSAAGFEARSEDFATFSHSEQGTFDVPVPSRSPSMYRT